MKSIKRISILIVPLFLLFLTFSGCGDKKSDTPVNENQTPAATCSDGIQNQGETGVDCGGPCPPCANFSVANGCGLFIGDSVVVKEENNYTFIYAYDVGAKYLEIPFIKLRLPSNFQIDSTYSENDFSALYSSDSGVVFNMTTGNIKISEHNITSNYYKGIFNFNGFDINKNPISFSTGEFVVYY